LQGGNCLEVALEKQGGKVLIYDDGEREGEGDRCESRTADVANINTEKRRQNDLGICLK